MERNKALAGFTLAEILVVLFIISLLSALTFANYRQGGKQMALQRAASKLAQDIRRAQEMAIAATECPSGTACAGQIPAGYGVFLCITGGCNNPTQYILYADVDNNQYFGAGDSIIATSTFESGIIISDIDNGPNPKRIAINFKPPDPEVKLKFASGIGNEVATTTITLSLGSLTKTVKVNKAGLIEIQ
jgi:prepilin-type N-terminal cleavage/methylation domain-containing protein